MTREMTVEEFAGWMGQLGDRVQRVAVDTLEWGQREALFMAVERSYGPYGTPVLREFDPPAFARLKRAAPAIDASVVNFQSGRFAGDWYEIGVHGDGPDLFAGAVNYSDEANWLATGTPTMFERPLAQAVLRELEGPVQAHLESSARTLLGG